MEQQVRDTVAAYLDVVVERGSCDLVADISGPFPMDVISAVLGIPAADRPVLRGMADKLLVREDGSMSIPSEALDGMFGLFSRTSVTTSATATRMTTA
jgi:cytochrome P450